MIVVSGSLDGDFVFECEAALREGETVRAEAFRLVLQMECPIEEVVATIARARSAGVRVLLNLAPARPIPIEAPCARDLLVVNESEADGIHWPGVKPVPCGERLHRLDLRSIAGRTTNGIGEQEGRRSAPSGDMRPQIRANRPCGGRTTAACPPISPFPDGDRDRFRGCKLVARAANSRRKARRHNRAT